MSKIKTALIAAGLAFFLNNLCLLLFLGGVFVGQWLLYPAIYIADDLCEPGWLRVAVAYLLGFLQFFIALWVGIAAVCWLNKRKPPTI